jgi:hypothetical protein
LNLLLKLHEINNIINFKIVVEIVSTHTPLVLELDKLDTIGDGTKNNTKVIPQEQLQK